MGDDRLGEARLTRQQLACLEKAAEHKDSYQIAHELGIAKNTVDIHIAKAVAKLGVGGRREAAKVLLECRPKATDSTSSDIFWIDIPSHPTPETSAPEQTDSVLRDGSDLGESPSDQPKFANQPNGGETANRYNLNALQTLGITLMLVFAICLIMIASIPMSNAVQEMADLWCHRTSNGSGVLRTGQRGNICSKNVVKPPATSPRPSGR